LWLQASLTTALYQNCIKRRIEGTCEWILNRPEVLDWMFDDFPSNRAKIFWMNGPPGYGKSILSAKIVEHLLETSGFPLAYYFFSSDLQGRGDPLIAVKSWISQLVTRDRKAFQIASAKWEDVNRRMATQNDIVDILRSIVQETANCTFILDGLDECTWTSLECSSPIELFQVLAKIFSDTKSRVMIISRNEPNIRSAYQAAILSHPSLKPTEYHISPEDVRSDSQLFARKVVNTKLANKSVTQKEELSLKLASRSDGMFLWIQMLGEEFDGWMNKKKLENIIDHAPAAINNLYDHQWNKISNLPTASRALSILRWVTFALRPLTVLEITEALTIADEGEDLDTDELPDTIDEEYIKSGILGICGSFVETQNADADPSLDSMTIRLSHFSVKQYILLKISSQSGLLLANEPLRESYESNVLATLCLRYLNSASVWGGPLQFDTGASPRAFRVYANSSWHKHIFLDSQNYSIVVDHINRLFTTKNPNWVGWRTWYDTLPHETEQDKLLIGLSTTPLFYASLLGMHETARNLIKECNFDVNHIQEDGRTAIQAACSAGHQETVRFLLESGADISISDNKGRTPIFFASKAGIPQVAKLLLDTGADGNVLTNHGGSTIGAAVESGNMEIVKLLIEHGVHFNTAHQDKCTSSSCIISYLKVALKV
jgi:predicted ATPase